MNDGERPTQSAPENEGSATRGARGGAATVVSPWSVAETITRLSAVVAALGMKLFGIVDHSAEAEGMRRRLRETKVVSFGDPEAQALVIDAAPLSAIDLPHRVVVWADGNQTRITYLPVATLAARHGLEDRLASRLPALEELIAAVIEVNGRGEN